MNEALVNINGESIQTLEILFMLTLISLIPSIVIMTSAFTRIIIVISFLRTGMGMQQTPPNTVLVGIALFLTLFIMTPTMDQINEVAYTPYKNDLITQEEALELAQVPMKEFMFKNTSIDTLEVFMGYSGHEPVEDVFDIPLTIVIPSFLVSELSRGFTMGFLLFLPFLLIDMVVACTLMSMGMMMLPPATVSLPFKVLLFVSIDGWQLLFSTLVRGFN